MSIQVYKTIGAPCCKTFQNKNRTSQIFCVGTLNYVWNQFFQRVFTLAEMHSLCVFDWNKSTRIIWYEHYCANSSGWFVFVLLFSLRKILFDFFGMPWDCYSLFDFFSQPSRSNHLSLFFKSNFKVASASSAQPIEFPRELYIIMFLNSSLKK